MWVQLLLRVLLIIEVFIMKIKNQIFLSFTTKEEYLTALSVWKWNMSLLVRTIRSNKAAVRRAQVSAVTSMEGGYNYFIIQDLQVLAERQRNEISFAKSARQMHKIRNKMKKLAGQQMAERIASESKNLVGV